MRFGGNFDQADSNRVRSGQQLKQDGGWILTEDLIDSHV